AEDLFAGFLKQGNKDDEKNNWTVVAARLSTKRDWELCRGRLKTLTTQYKESGELASVQADLASVRQDIAQVSGRVAEMEVKIDAVADKVAATVTKPQFFFYILLDSKHFQAAATAPVVLNHFV
ncbi:hypothetical protein JG687_00015174, partial [Phytophthora cactorum]